MKPSVFAHFLIFILIGLTSTFDYKFETDPWVQAILIIVVFTSASYYYYLNLATEQNWPLKNKAPTKKVFTWIITSVQYIILLLLWYLLRQNWIYYSLGLFMLNLTYLIWDFVHKADLKNDHMGRIWYWDLAGVFLSFLLILFTFELPPEEISNATTAHHAMAIAIVGGFLIAQSISGLVAAIILFKYNPFHK